MALYRRRLEWLTSESRRIFGVVEEKAVTVVMDVRNMSPEQFDQYRQALQRVLKEQFKNCTKFNIIRYTLSHILFWFWFWFYTAQESSMSGLFYMLILFLCVNQLFQLK